MAIDYKGMALFHCRSERTIRRWETERPSIFETMMNQYNQSNANSTTSQSGIVIVALSLKGGVGKSTVIDNLAYVLGSDAKSPDDSDAVVLNLDFGQSSSGINASYTIDYAEHSDQLSVSDMIENLMERYRYVLIDTPGDPTPEIAEAMCYTKKVIIPMTIGERTEEATIATLNTYFGEGAQIEGSFDMFFLFNMYTDRKKRDDAAERFKDSYSKFVPSNGITIRPKLGSMDASNAISTAEYARKSVFQLASENKAVYAVAARKITSLCALIEDHFNLQ